MSFVICPDCHNRVPLIAIENNSQCPKCHAELGESAAQAVSQDSSQDLQPQPSLDDESQESSASNSIDDYLFAQVLTRGYKGAVMWAASATIVLLVTMLSFPISFGRALAAVIFLAALREIRSNRRGLRISTCIADDERAQWERRFNISLISVWSAFAIWTIAAIVGTAMLIANLRQ